MTAETYQSRVLEERDELDERITKLDAFINGTSFKPVQFGEKQRLRMQLAAMRWYLAILQDRIAAW